MTDPDVLRFLEHHSWEGTASALMIRLCAGLLAECQASIPVNVHALASFRGAVVEVADQPQSGMLAWDGTRLVIRIRRADPEVRQRFTVCHEICHTLFPDFHDTPKQRSEQHVERFDPREPVEYLCDLGAAELLLPRTSLEWLLPDSFTIEHIIAVAERFRASIEASAIRCVDLARSPVAFAILEPDDVGALRVRYTAANGLPDVPRGIVVGDTSPLSGVGTQPLAYRGKTGLIDADLAVSARHLPYRRDGKLIGRVLVLLQP